MSHAVTVTRTTTTVTTTSAILLNTGYLKTVPGLLKLFQLIIGCVVVGIVGHYNSFATYSFFTAEQFLLVTSASCLIATACLLISCLLSISTATIIAKTMFELVYHGAAFFLYLASSVHVLILVSPYSQRQTYIQALIAAGVIVLLTPQSVLYLFSSLSYFSVIVSRNAGYKVSEYGYSDKLFAGALGVVNTILYFVSAFLAFRNYRRA